MLVGTLAHTLSGIVLGTLCSSRYAVLATAREYVVLVGSHSVWYCILILVYALYER